MMDNDENSSGFAHFKRLCWFVGVVVAIIAVLFAIYRALLISFLVSLFFSYLLLPFTEKLIQFCRGRRTLAVFSLVAFLLAIVIGVVASILPFVYQQLIEIIKRLPIAAQYLMATVEPLKNFLVETGLLQPGGVDALLGDLSSIGTFSGQLKNIGGKMLDSTTSVLGGVINSALVPVFLFFILRDFHKLKKLIHAAVPQDLVGPMNTLKERIDFSLRSVFKGQLIVALTLGFLYIIGLEIIGLEFGIAIGAAAGVCRIVPYLDVVVGLALSFIVIMTKYTGVGQIMGVCGIFLIVQILDGMLITPRIIGDRTGLNPVIIITTVIAFGDWFGFIGILLAIPVLVLLTAAVEMLFPVYLKSSFYLSTYHEDSSRSNLS